MGNTKNNGNRKRNVQGMMIAGANRNLLKKQYTHMSVIYGQITVRECCRIIWSPTMKAIVDSHTTSENRMLFKLAVEMAIMMNILAAHCDIEEGSLANLRQNCIDEVKRINGTLGFEDAYYWQKG